MIVDDSEPCVVCLEKIRNRTVLKDCQHCFCFHCIKEWAKISPTCPLCKKSLTVGLCDIKSETDYKEYVFDPPLERPRGYGVSYSRIPYRVVMPEDREHPSERTRRSGAWAARIEQRESDTIAFRASIYEKKLFANYVGTNSESRYQNATDVLNPRLFCQYPARLDRLRPWIRRDLLALLHGDIQSVNIVYHLIISLLSKYHPQTEDFMAPLRPLLHDRTEHFVHELVQFARSPFSVSTYDQTVQYGSVSNDVSTSAEHYDGSAIEPTRKRPRDEDGDERSPSRRS